MSLLPQVDFSAKNLNFHSRWRDWIQTILLNIFYFITASQVLSFTPLPLAKNIQSLGNICKCKQLFGIFATHSFTTLMTRPTRRHSKLGLTFMNLFLASSSYLLPKSTDGTPSSGGPSCLKYSILFSSDRACRILWHWKKKEIE